MYVIIRMEDGNLFDHGLWAKEYPTLEDARRALKELYVLEYSRIESSVNDCQCYASDEPACAFVTHKDGSRVEWRIVRPIEPVVRHITRDEVRQAFDSGIARLCPDFEGNTICMMGERWFRFDDDCALMGPTAYGQTHTMDHIVAAVAGVLLTWRETDEVSWWYFRTLVDQEL